jgi:hypothetical protein
MSQKSLVIVIRGSRWPTLPVCTALSKLEADSQTFLRKDAADRLA